MIFHSEACLGCGNCTDACPFGAIPWNEDDNHPLICSYCGVCAEYCPYDVIVLEDVADVRP